MRRKVLVLCLVLAARTRYTQSRDWFHWYDRLEQNKRIISGVKVHVYSDPPFNWLHKNCTAMSSSMFSNYPHFKHAGLKWCTHEKHYCSQKNLPNADDYWFAKQALQLLNEGRSVDPHEANIFIVPALLNLCVSIIIVILRSIWKPICFGCRYTAAAYKQLTFVKRHPFVYWHRAWSVKNNAI